ncbi:hypothetical protein CNMCM8980_002950 [Aspergillus fumigatiaffinis]|nr:hypothetical protein CNMCM8980_002950 [Aspergillus fumigatiaffinis]
MEQHETLLQGLDTISSLLPRLLVIEEHFLHRETGLSADLRRTLEKNMILLCSKVLEFQSRAICYLEKRTARQFSKDLLKQDGWDGILGDIERYDTLIKDATSSVHVLEVNKKLEEHRDALQQMQVWQTTSVKDQQRANLFQRLYACPYKDRKDRNNKRVLGTCEWFSILNSQSGTKAGTLNCYGFPQIQAAGSQSSPDTWLTNICLAEREHFTKVVIVLRFPHFTITFLPLFFSH